MSEILIHKIIQKDKKAQKEFYFRYSTQLFRLTYRYVINEQDAASIVNSGFYKIFTNISNFNYANEKSLIAWMSKIVVNEALMFLRQQAIYIDIDEVNHHFSEENLPVEKLIAEDYYRLIRELPIDLRTVFNLFAIDGYSHREIAEKLDIKESSSRVYLTRARSILQQRLKHHGR
jgi:RNA polymerase sigma-70 factor (ECF subfamily)